MKKADFQEWQKQKAGELFSLSHKLLDVAKKLSEEHAAELRENMAYALDLAKTSAKSDLIRLKELQHKAALESTKRMSHYQKQVKLILRDMGNDAAIEAEKYLEKARYSLSDWLEDAEKKMPVGGEKLAKVVRDVSNAGAKVFKEGRKLVNDALDVAEKKVAQAKLKPSEKSLARKTLSKKIPAKRIVDGKRAALKRVGIKKPAVKKRKTAARKATVKLAEDTGSANTKN